ncbi:conjugal transfer protein TraG N-terminal domain-containing protein [Burkholderia cepacia]|uniref:conjugal transfer protein TraG N-terminal domain-containing protein n=1 Tax=Burkholderia cepacia TaxID=292 RepID=UPI002AB7A7C6|nr:conjugal transfer protein TraG N-terminal domain-containing protein [Burkholderia cepacia]
MWTIYTMWNGQNVTLMLQAVAATFSDNSFTGLLRTASLLAFFAVIIGVAARGRMDGLWQWFLGFMVMVTLGVTVKTNVNVIDYRFNYAQQVQDVPFVLAIGYGEISHFGYWMTQKYETKFTPPGSSTFEQYGMVFGAQVAATMASLKASDPIVNDNIISITQTCLAPEFIQNPLSIATVVKSTDLAADVPQILNPGRLADITDVNGNTDVMPCDVAWQTAMQQYDSSSASLYNYAVAKMLPGQTTIGRLQNNPSVVTALASNIPTVADQLLINSSQTTAGMIKQAALANAIRMAGSKLQTNVAAINEQLAGAMATSASDNTYAVMSTLAANVLPALHNVIELIVIGVFPLVIVMAFVAGPMILGVMRMWLTAAGWIQFWGPLYALVNGIMSSQSNIPSIVSAINGNGNPGMSMQNMGTVFGQAMSEQQLASMICLSVPLLSYALVRGGEMVMTSLASGVISPAQSAAQRAGDEVGHGNISMGTASWGNVNTNNTNSNSMRTSTSVDTGTTSVKGADAVQLTWGNLGAGMGGAGAGGGAGGGATTSFGAGGGGGGNQLIGMNASSLSWSGGPVDAAFSSSVSQSLQKEAGQSFQQGQQASMRWADSMVSAHSNLQQSGWRTGSSWSSSQQAATGVSSQDAQSLDSAMQQANNFARSQGISTNHLLQSAMAARGGLSLNLGAGQAGGGGSVGASGGVSGSSTNSNQQGTSASETAGQTFANTDAFKTLESLSRSANMTNTGTSGTSGETSSGGSVSSSLTKSHSDMNEVSSSAQRSQQYREAAQVVAQGGASVRQNLLNMAGNDSNFGAARVASDIKKSAVGDASGAADLANYAVGVVKSDPGKFLAAMGSDAAPGKVAAGAAIQGGVNDAVAHAPPVPGSAGGGTSSGGSAPRGARPSPAFVGHGGSRAPQPAISPDMRNPALARVREEVENKQMDVMSQHLDSGSRMADAKHVYNDERKAARRGADAVRDAAVKDIDNYN